MSRTRPGTHKDFWYPLLHQEPLPTYLLTPPGDQAFPSHFPELRGNGNPESYPRERAYAFRFVSENNNAAATALEHLFSRNLGITTKNACIVHTNKAGDGELVFSAAAAEILYRRFGLPSGIPEHDEPKPQVQTEPQEHKARPIRKRAVKPKRPKKTNSELSSGLAATLVRGAPVRG